MKQRWKHSRYFLILVTLLALMLVSGCTGTDKQVDKPELKLATTTSTYDSGLLDEVLPVFEEKYGYQVSIISVGTGAALETGKRGDSDVVLVHAKDAELALVEQGYFVDRSDVMYNDFVIVGPQEDPAGVGNTREAVAAFQRIADQQTVFVSRGDDSGTHKKEITIWQKAGLEPMPGKWYQSVGQGMGATLRMAGEIQGYTLTDRGTWLALKDDLDLDLKIVMEGDPVLFNQYGVMAVNPEKHPRINYPGAKALIDFLISGEGQELIAGFKKDGEQLFIPNAPGVSNQRTSQTIGFGQTSSGTDPSGEGPESGEGSGNSDLGDGIAQAFGLIMVRDPVLMQIISLSLQVSGLAVFLAALGGIPLGTWLGMQSPARIRWPAQIIYTFMGLPPVLVGLLVYLLISARGPFGVLDLLFTPTAMVIAQTVLALPIVTGLTMVAVRSKEREIRDTAVSLGAGGRQVALTVVREARVAVMGAVVAGMGRILAEVGAVMMVGGNIEGKTRVMTTAIVLETRRGNFELAVGLGLVLLALAFMINSLLYRLQGGFQD